MTDPGSPERSHPDRAQSDRAQPDRHRPDRHEPTATGANSDGLSPDDLALLATLRDVLLDVDPVPDLLLEAARASLTWRTVDEELATLVADSALEGSSVRAGDAARVLTFTIGAATLILEIVRTGMLRRLIGQLVGDLAMPSASTPRRQIAADTSESARTLRLQRLEQETRLELDDLGHFVAEDVPAGPARFAFSLPGGRRAVTSWVTV